MKRKPYRHILARCISRRRTPRFLLMGAGTMNWSREPLEHLERAYAPRRRSSACGGAWSTTR